MRLGSTLRFLPPALGSFSLTLGSLTRGSYPDCIKLLCDHTVCKKYYINKTEWNLITIGIPKVRSKKWALSHECILKFMVWFEGLALMKPLVERIMKLLHTENCTEEFVCFFFIINCHWRKLVSKWGCSWLPTFIFIAFQKEFSRGDPYNLWTFYFALMCVSVLERERRTGIIGYLYLSEHEVRSEMNFKSMCVCVSICACRDWCTLAVFFLFVVALISIPSPDSHFVLFSFKVWYQR